DSIRSVQLLALAKERGLNFSLPQLFQYQTVAELARQIVPGEAGPAAEVVCEPFSLISEEDRRRLPADVEDAYPLATLQAGMFYHMELMPDAPVYHNVDDWHLRAPFDPETFERAAQYVVRRHAVLRTSFDLTSYGEPLQLVHREAVLPIRVEDLRHLPPAEQEEALNAFVERERATRFDPSRAPQLRFAVHRRTDESFHFTLTESHTIFDGWSLTSTLAEIFTRYFALLRGEAPPEEPPPAVSFRDFVRLERLALESEECRRYWERTLGDCAVLRLPGHDGSPARGDGRRIQTVNVAVSPQLSDGLKRAARAAGVPVKSVLLAAHLKALSLISGQADVLAGLASNGRPEVSDGTDVRGLFLNTLPFRLRLRKGTWLDLVRETFAAEREMLPYRRYPLGAMQRRWGNQALVETQFNFVHFHALDRVLQSGDIEVLEGGRRRSEETHFAFCAMFSLSFLSTQVGLDLEYDTRAFSEEQVKVFAGYYAAILEAVAADPLAPHHAQSFHSPAERRKIIGEWNATRAEYPRDRCVQHLFEEQARRTPDRVAVVCGEGRLTYGELDRRANQLAHFLRGLGVGPETPVGICVERSPEMVTGLLGILKAGGAYV
ncbi:MAG TPA: condensation domain-containing protein, partial [Pyrinomonadaceae bacterium]